MSQIKKGGPVSRRGPSYKKSVYVYTRDGNLVAAKWPEPRKGNISQKQKDEMERFRQTQWLTKYVPGFIMAEIIDLVAGTTLLPRDLITQGMYGRLFSIGVNGGKVMVPMAFKVDVSTSLDTIGQTEGQMMVRGSALWDPLPQGRVGQRLVSQGPGTAPLWQSVLTGDTEAMITSSFQNEDVTDAMAMSGSFFRPALNISVFSVWAALTLVDTATYHAIIARVAVEDIVEVIWRSSGRVATAAGKEAWVYDLPVPVTLIENQTYIVCIYRSDATAATNVKVRKGTGQIMGFPAKANETAVRFASVNPVVGDTVDLFGTAKAHCVHLIYGV